MNSARVAQDRREVTVVRRVASWQAEMFSAADAVVEFRSVKQAMTVAEIYEGVA